MRRFRHSRSEWEYSACFVLKSCNLPRLRSLTITFCRNRYLSKSSSLDGVITQLYNKLTEEAYTLPSVGGVPSGISGRSGLLRRNVGPVWTDQATLTQQGKSRR